MTRIAVIADVHGNAPALDAVLEEIGAFWLMLHPEPKLRRTDYDVARTAERVRTSDYWDAERAASEWLDPLDPRELEESCTSGRGCNGRGRDGYRGRTGARGAGPPFAVTRRAGCRRRPSFPSR